MFSDEYMARSKPYEDSTDISTDSDETFVFQDVLDLVNIPNKGPAEYDQSWGTYAIESEPWKDDKCPYENPRKKDDLMPNSMEMRGTLSERMIAACSSYLKKSPITQKYILAKCNLSKSNLHDIDLLKYHVHFEYIDLSHNRLTDVSALHNSAMLMYIDASFNMLEDVLDFRPPLNLTIVNYSHNCICEMGDLEHFWSITKLDISHNDIGEINGVNSLRYLQYLDLSHNNITVLNNIHNLSNLMYLNLSYNQINIIQCSIKDLQQLKYINLSHNKLKSLKCFRANSMRIRQINISHNLIVNLLQITNLQLLTYLVDLDMRDNKIASNIMFWEVAINCLRGIKILNSSYVDASQKVHIKNKFDPIPEMSLSKKRNMLLLLNNLKTKRIISDCLLPANIPPPPLIVLVGPLACRKKFIAIKLSESDDNVQLMVNHTTRPKTYNETEGLQYFFIDKDKFDGILKEAEFITVLESFGHRFGLHNSQLNNMQNDNTVFVTHSDLINALLLRDQGYMPTIVLAIPKSEETHRQWLKEQYRNDYMNVYCKNICHPEIRRISSGILQDTHSYLDNIVEEVLLMPKSDENIPSIKPSTDEPSDDGPVLESCFRKRETSREKSAETKCRPTVSFGVVMDALTKQKKDISVTLLGYESEETLMICSINTNQQHSSISGLVKSEQFPVENKQSHQTDDRTTDIQPSDDEQMNCFIDSVIKTRNLYIDYHRENPGVFVDAIFTDDPNNGLEKLKTIAKELKIPRVFKNVYSFLGEEDNARMIDAKKKEITRALKCNISTAACQEMAVESYVHNQVNFMRYTD